MRRLLALATTLILGTLVCFQDKCLAQEYSAKRSGQRVEVRMKEYEAAFRNTMKGLREFFAPGLDRRRADYPYPYGSMIKEYMQWNMLERDSTDGVERVKAYSNHRWQGVEEQNIKVIPRAYIVWIEPWHSGPEKSLSNADDLRGQHWPNDIAEQVAPYKSLKKGEWACYFEQEDSLTRITGGYFDPSFPRRLERLIEKLGQAWDNDPRVAYVEMGLIGEWGEHHDPNITTYWPPHDEPHHVEGRTWIKGIEKTLGDSFSKAFRHKKVMVRYAYEFQDYEFGIYWDSWAIDEERERGYNAMLRLGDRWKTEVIGGEVTWAWGSLYLKGHLSFEDCVADAETRNLIIEQIRDLHCNHLGGITWANFENEEFIENVASVQKALGYRFVLERASYPALVKAGERWNVEFSLRNVGSSPFYYDWPLEVVLLDAKTLKRVWSAPFDGVKISQWMPGEKWNSSLECYTEPAELIKVEGEFDAPKIEKGEYIVALAIADPAGGMPSVRFANTNYLEGGYTALGKIGICCRVKSPQIESEQFFDLQSDRTLRYSLRP